VPGPERIAAFGNSDGDREMPDWQQAGGGARLMMPGHHNDAKRESAHGAGSPIGAFSGPLMTKANPSGWTVISMKGTGTASSHSTHNESRI